MPASSLRNAVKRITHKERSQPVKRQHLGILEKKKDYKVRAKNYHKKQDELKRLERKASFKNPDEFYFGMKNAVVDSKDGKHRKTPEAFQKDNMDIIGADAVRIMKEQDLKYVRMQKQADLNKVNKLRSTLHYVGATNFDTTSNDDEINAKRRKIDVNRVPKNKHTIFVDTNEQANNFDIAKHFDTLPELVGRSFNRPRMSTLRSEILKKVKNTNHEDEDEYHDKKIKKPTATKEDLAWEKKKSKRIAQKIAKARSTSYNELQARMKRIETMELAESHLLTEKISQEKGRKRKIKEAANGKPAQYVFTRKRKR